MEYPTLFASDGPFWALPSWLPDPAQDVVATHELAHQWFACLLANDEVAHPMLDEGLAQWASLDFVRADYAPWIRLFGFGPFELMRAATLARPRKLPSSLLSADRYNAATLGPAVYARPALVLERIAERKGRPQLRAALERYAESQRFRHPEPDDLFAAFDRVFGRGFGTRVLKNALEGDDPRQLRAPVDEHAPKPSGLTLLPELWALVQTLLRWFGP
jgi:aminopeptidase N